MSFFRVLLVILFNSILVYTMLVVANHGFAFLDIFFRDIAALSWPGQFNVDFLSLLILSSFWIAWRHNYSSNGFALAILTFFGGGLFLTLYLFWTSFRFNGNMQIILLGESRA